MMCSDYTRILQIWHHPKKIADAEGAIRRRKAKDKQLNGQKKRIIEANKMVPFYANFNANATNYPHSLIKMLML